MEADVARLQGWFQAGELLRPGPPAPSTVDLIRALAHLAGAPDYAADPGANRLAELIGPAEHLVFVLVDGLGLNLVEGLPEQAFLRRRQALALRSVFPSATASAITALATGDWPARHGVPGWWTYFPEHALTAVALPFIERFSGQPLGERGIEAAQVYPLPALLERFQRDAHCFQPQRISGSAYSDYFRGTTPNGGYGELAEGIQAVIERVRAADQPTYSYLYVPTLDEVQHTHGPQSPQVAEHLAELDQALGDLATQLAGRATLVISADHGLVHVPPERKHVLEAHDPLLALLAVPPSGEPRAPVFHVREGARETFRAAFAERFAETYALLAVDEVEQLELLGPGALAPQTRARVGDFLAISAGADVLLSRRGEAPTSTETMLGFHGGLLPDEMRIPLIVSA